MMIGVLVVTLGIQVFIILLARKEKLPEGKELSSVLQPFYRAGVWAALRVSEWRVFSKDREKLRTLYPSDNADDQLKWFLAEKMALCLLIVFAGCAIAILIEVKNQGEGYLQDGGILNRREYSDGDYTAYLTAAIGEDVRQTMEIEIGERQYTADEIQEMLPSFYETLEETVLGENTSADHISQKVNLTESVKGYPFRIEWSSSNKDILDRYGVFGEEISENGELITLSAKISYRDFLEIYTFPLMVYPVELSREEQVRRDLQQKLEETVGRSPEETEIFLPEEVDGIRIVWTEQKKQNALVLLLLVFGSSAAVFWGQSNDLDKKIKERSEQMLQDYPEVVSKMTLFIGAGMTVRGAWKKVAADYRQRREKGQASRYVYEEMLFTLYEMESGIGEMAAYQRFAGRCQVQKYIKFAALLEQNVRLGAKGFLSELNREAKDAFEERKSKAKQLGETAGSKLMLPMFLMLGIVMVVIMVPSFLSIGM